MDTTLDALRCCSCHICTLGVAYTRVVSTFFFAARQNGCLAMYVSVYLHTTRCKSVSPFVGYPGSFVLPIIPVCINSKAEYAGRGCVCQE